MRSMMMIVLLFVAGCSSPSTGSDAGMDAGTEASSPMDAAEGGGGACSAVVKQLLTPVDMVSTRDVLILADSGGVKTVYVDGSAGGFMPTEARVYVKLATATRVDITDTQAATSMDWDLAFKRYVIFQNSGDAGPGMGGTLAVSKAFDQVTMADATGKTLLAEQFTDKDCNPITDMLGGVNTTMSTWYDYDMQTMAVTPKANVTYVIRSASGVLYKLAIQSYYATPDGGTSMSGAHYLLKVAAL